MTPYVISAKIILLRTILFANGSLHNLEDLLSGLAGCIRGVSLVELGSFGPLLMLLEDLPDGELQERDLRRELWPDGEAHHAPAL